MFLFFSNLVNISSDFAKKKARKDPKLMKHKLFLIQIIQPTKDPVILKDLPIKFSYSFKNFIKKFFSINSFFFKCIIII